MTVSDPPAGTFTRGPGPIPGAGTSRPADSRDGPETGFRIGMAVHAYYEKDARVRRYAESLVRKGHHVEVIALRAPGAPAEEWIEGVLCRRVPMHRRRGGALRYLYEYLAFLLWATWYLAKGTWRRPYDVIHVHNMPDFLVFCGIVPKLFGARIVLDVHDLMPEVWASKFHSTLSHPAVLILRIQEIASHFFADHVVFATGIFREIALARGTVRPEKSSVVLNAPDTDLFDEERQPWTGPERPGEFRLLYLGTVSERHGVDQLVRVLPLCRARIPGLRLVIHPKLEGGEGKPLEELLDLAKRLGVEDLVEVRPSLDLAEVPEAMSRASVGTFTPHVDLHIDIALSLKIPEYVAMGLPIVTVRTRIMESLFHPGEVRYFEDEDLEGFAEILCELHEHPDRGRALARRAKRFLEEHSWEREFEGYHDVLRGLRGTAVLPAD